VVEKLQVFSMGKYSSKLYHQGRSEHTTILSIVFSVVIVLGTLGGSVQTLVQLFQRKSIAVEENIIVNSETKDIIDSKVSELPTQVLFENLYLYIQPK
jgi:hypothetical protein